MTITPAQVYTNDKSHLHPGPWQDEHDKVVWVDETTGLDCMIVRSHFGAWCGYVGVTTDHQFYGHGYNDLPYLDVHGWLTFSDSCHDKTDESSGICHIPQEGRPHDIWMIGFD